MSKIVEINWNTFKSKFDGKEQDTFEWLCYLLFCKEFKKNTGIPRFKNHAGIETDPIDVDGVITGWQAKFYGPELSKKTGEFIASIDQTKKKYPNIDKIIFYVNQDFGQAPQGTDPKYKQDIEAHAKELAIEIEWRQENYFRSPFVCEENANIANHFFSIEKSVYDFIDELAHHSGSILSPIRSKISFNSKDIKINRSELINDLKMALSKSSLIILAGEGGVGKTAVIKDFYDADKEKSAMYVFKATEFNVGNINNLFTNFGQFTFLDFIQEHKEVDNKYIVLDSAEKLSDLENQDIFKEFLSTLLENHWKIIFTTRHIFLDDLKFQLIEVYHNKFKSLNIGNLSLKELKGFSEKYDFNLPKNERLLSLIQNPFYLNEYLQIYENKEEDISLSSFKKKLWNRQILKSSYRQNNTHLKREECFLKIAKKRSDEGFLYVKVNEDNDDILHRLEEDEIIKYDSAIGGYFITHDIYEEWALDIIIERSFNPSASNKEFFENIGSSLPIRRAFRLWMSEKLENNKDEIWSFIESALFDDEVGSHWKDEVLISLLLSKHSQLFFDTFEEKILENDQKLLLRIIFLLRIACKDVDERLLNIFGLLKSDDIQIGSIYTQPKGNGWSSVIGFIHKHRERLGLSHYNKIINLLWDWI